MRSGGYEVNTVANTAFKSVPVFVYLEKTVSKRQSIWTRQLYFEVDMTMTVEFHRLECNSM